MYKRQEEATFWAEEAVEKGDGKMSALLQWMDEARVIMTYDTERTQQGMYTAYGTDDARREAHRGKMVDVGEHVAAHAGRRLRMSTFLRANGRAHNAGAGCDTDALWERGRTGAIRDACMRDVRALAEVALARTMRSMDGASIPAVPSAREAVLENGREDERGTGRAEHGDCLLYTSPSPRD